ncbi:unnamed protein product, partial [Didymodactylos carnosus]
MHSAAGRALFQHLTFKSNIQQISSRYLSSSQSTRLCKICSSSNFNRSPSFLNTAQQQQRNLLTTKCLRRHHLFSTPQQIRYASTASLPSHQKLTLPALSPTMETGTLRSWSKQEGDKIVEGDIIAEIETDKTTLGFEVGEEGYLAKIVLPAGSKDVPVGSVCAIVVEKQEDIAAFKDYKDEGGKSTTSSTKSDGSEKKETKAPEKKKETSKGQVQQEKEHSPSENKTTKAKETEENQQQAQGEDGKDHVFISPLAKKLANEKGIDIKSVQGSGPNGRIIAEDVEKFIKDGGAKQQQVKPATAKEQQSVTKTKKEKTTTTGGYDEIDISEIQAATKRVAQSKATIPHYYLTIEIEMNQIIKLRQTLNDMLQSKDKKAKGITITDFVIKAAALACKKVPETNSVWMDKMIRQYETVDINVAIATDAGLMTPIIYNVDQKGLSQISNDVAELSEKANQGKLSADELETMAWKTLTSRGLYSKLRPLLADALRDYRALYKIQTADYHEKVIEHYENPRNVGSFDKSDDNIGTGLVGAPACGDVMKLQIKVDENGKIVDAKFKTFGCGSAIASSSLATEWIKGKSVNEANTIKNSDIAKELCLPPVKLHC